MKGKIFIYLIIAGVLYYFISKQIRRKKYMQPFLEMGFSKYYLSKFTTEELFLIWNYLKNYSLKGIALTPSVDANLYNRVKAINDKYHIFSNLK